jgi:single-strand DNA-binding protein
MFSLNRAMIIGNATRDPEMRYTPNGQAVISFGVATNRRWTDRNTGEMQEQVEFHDIVAWGKLAENISQIVKKGMPVYVEGRLQTRQWEGQDGAKRQRTEIVADNIIALGSRGSRSTDSSDNPVEEIADEKKPGKKPKGKDDEVEEIDIEDIPF